MSVLRIVANQTYDRDEFVKLICETINSVSERREGAGAKIADIVEVWGDPWWKETEQKTRLALDCYKLADRDIPVLERTGVRGFFRVSRHYQAHGNSGYEAFERALLPEMIAAGGFMTFKDIRGIFDITAHSGTEKKLKSYKRRTRRLGIKRAAPSISYDDGQDSYLRKALDKSKVIRHDFGVHGLWNLAAPLLASIPEEGRYTRLMVARGFRSVMPEDGMGYNAIRLNKQAGAQVAMQFASVGAAYRALRDLYARSITDIMSSPSVRAAIVCLADQHPFAQAFADFIKAPPERTEDDTRPKAWWELAQFGGSTDDWPLICMAMFEDGDVATHEVALTDFHRAFADYYGVSATALSRGRIAPASDDVSSRDLLREIMRAAPEGGSGPTP